MTTISWNRHLAPSLALLVAAGLLVVAGLPAAVTGEAPTETFRTVAEASGAPDVSLERDGARVAAMQALVRRTSEQSGAALRSTEALSAEHRDGFVRIGLRVQVDASFKSAMQMLGRLAAERDLWLGSLSLQRKAGIGNQDELVVSFVVFSFGPVGRNAGAADEG